MAYETLKSSLLPYRQAPAAKQKIWEVKENSKQIKILGSSLKSSPLLSSGIRQTKICGVKNQKILAHNQKLRKTRLTNLLTEKIVASL